MREWVITVLRTQFFAANLSGDCHRIQLSIALAASRETQNDAALSRYHIW
jgi:hypothetical protein